MFNLLRFILKIFVVVCMLGLAGCAGEIIEEGYYDPDSPEAAAWRDEQHGDDANLGPNAPGYLGPDGEYSLYPDSDPH